MSLVLDFSFGEAKLQASEVPRSREKGESSDGDGYVPSLWPARVGLEHWPLLHICGTLSNCLVLLCLKFCVCKMDAMWSFQTKRVAPNVTELE